MAIFGDIKAENVLQQNDKTRILASQSFTSTGEAAITNVEIQPEAAAGFISVFNSNPEKWFLDWAYATTGTKTIELRITTDGAPQTFSRDIEVVSEADDRLFSNDSDLVEIEDDILNYVRAGRNSYKDKHRQAQKRIIDSLDRRRIFDSNGNRLTKNDLYTIDEIRQWSTYLTLEIIYEGLRVSPDDLYTQKADSYNSLARAAEHSAVIRLDTNQDGNEDRAISLMSGALLRR